MLLIGGIAAAAVFVLWPRRAWPEFVFPAAVGIVSRPLLVSDRRDAPRLLAQPQGHRRPPAAGELAGHAPGPRRASASFLLGTTSDYLHRGHGALGAGVLEPEPRAVYNLSTPEPAGGLETAVQVTPAERADHRRRRRGSRSGRRSSSRARSYAIDGRARSRPARRSRSTGRTARCAWRRRDPGSTRDGWMGADAAYTRYATKPRGHLAVILTPLGVERARRAGARAHSADPAARRRAPARRSRRGRGRCTAVAATCSRSRRRTGRSR